jgi:hypothetical protein
MPLENLSQRASEIPEAARGRQKTGSGVDINERSADEWRKLKEKEEITDPPGEITSGELLI